MAIEIAITHAGPVGEIALTNPYAPEEDWKAMLAVAWHFMNRPEIEVVVTSVTKEEDPPDRLAGQYGGWLHLEVTPGTDLPNLLAAFVRQVGIELYWDQIGAVITWGSYKPLLVEVTDGQDTVSRQVKVHGPGHGYRAPAPGDGIREWRIPNYGR